MLFGAAQKEGKRKARKTENMKADRINGEKEGNCKDLAPSWSIRWNTATHTFRKVNFEDRRRPKTEETAFNEFVK